jgi:CRISPR-associated protein Cmr1
MPRDIPECPKPPNPIAEPSHSYEIELITPLFGGGVESRVNDPISPIRPTAIRGQLEFWWRATVGAQYASRAELRAAQSEVWGSTEHASRVQVLVEPLARPSDPVPCARYDKQGDKFRAMPSWNSPFSGQLNALTYALFPFQGRLSKDRNRIEEEPASYIAKASFRLILRCPNELWALVEPAVWAWANFGGLGGRTRRGCGALRCKEMAPRDHAHFAEQVRQFAPQQSEIRAWPMVAECLQLRTIDPPGDPLQVWNWLIALFKHFRQGEGLGRNRRGPTNRPGRSRFPEPETIRRATGRRTSTHTRQTYMPDDAFPRAALGLPIVFPFKDEREGDPDQTVLYPSNNAEGERRERMASPLILKPLGLVDGQAIPLILRLRTPPLRSVDLRRGDTTLSLPHSTVVHHPRLATYPDSPLADSPNGSALDAFLALARSEGFTEVTG